MPTERRLRVNISLSCKSPVELIDRLLWLIQGPLRDYSGELKPNYNGDWACDFPNDDTLGVCIAARAIPMGEVDIEYMMRHAGCNEDTIQRMLEERKKRKKQQEEDDGDKESQPTS